MFWFLQVRFGLPDFSKVSSVYSLRLKTIHIIIINRCFAVCDGSWRECRAARYGKKIFPYMKLCLWEAIVGIFFILIISVFQFLWISFSAFSDEFSIVVKGVRMPTTICLIIWEKSFMHFFVFCGLFFLKKFIRYQRLAKYTNFFLFKFYRIFFFSFHSVPPPLS